MRSHSAAFIAIGFSQSTCLPASAAAMVCSACRWTGVATYTASIPSSRDQIAPVGVPPAGADLTSERLDEIDVSPG